MMQNDAWINDKTELRAAVREQIRLLDGSYIEDSDRAILERLRALPEWKAAPRVYAYFSVGREVDTAGIISLALESGKEVALPRVYGGGVMDFALLDELPERVFGIPQPAGGAPALRPGEGELLLVPALCFDAGGSARAEVIMTAICRAAPPSPWGWAEMSSFAPGCRGRNTMCRSAFW
jgi:5-formyltetrahydrofolate cyclo-ligase